MDQNELRKLLQEKAEALGTEALKKRGRLADEQLEQLEEIEQLEKLIDIHEKLKPPKVRKRLPVALILTACLAVVSVLLFVRLPRTDIELQAGMKKLHFILSEKTLFGNTLQMKALGVSGLQSVQLPREASQDTNSLQLSVAEMRADAELSETAGSITLSNLWLPPGTIIDLHSDDPTDGGNTYYLSLELPQYETFELDVTVKGRINMVFPGKWQGEKHYAGPKSITFLPRGRHIDLELNLLEKQGHSFGRLQARGLSFIRKEEYFETETKLAPQDIPTLTSGTLYFVDLNGQKYTLREGEDLRFEHSEGHIQDLRLADNQLFLKCQLSVKGITSGWMEKRVKLMPTLLQWFKAQQAPALLWGTALFLFGLVNQLLRWWKK